MELASPLTETYTDALVLTNVTKRFGDFVAVDNLSLNIPKGSIYGFLQGAWPFGVVEILWSMVALRRWWSAA